MKIKSILKRLNPCRVMTRKLRVRVVELNEEKSKLSNKVREKQAEIESLKRRIRRLERGRG